MIDGLLITELNKLTPGSSYIFLDYDGTLVPIIMNPEQSLADPELIEMLTELRSKYKLFIVSGRSPEEIKRFIPLDLNLICYHGACSIVNGKTYYYNNAQSFLGIFNEIYQSSLNLVNEFPGLRIYKKNLAVLYHFGLMKPQDVPALERVIVEISQKEHVDVYKGKMIFELRVPGVNKGIAIKNVRDEETALIAGDDATDECSFKYNEDAITIKVGPGKTSAHFRVNDYSEMREVLKLLLNNAEKRS
ncbi:trehalose-phosphatase [Thermoplasma volcanium GSS1]|uniref:Trehalose 6-phosphate phosphatase n=1 Tax=Thermoplasma volcanium (strain ATCC 51530 / DSM 4299 / JCM 9571 / NBRC 15438 / GSS1) TaxID=273116 RepID=Q978Y6_THEVO|nr:trehalose-phosphatase [Thermoplasma volcanium]BAB60420.1 trehalose-phosphatase [Thermoplasma volcanium GSS1]